MMKKTLLKVTNLNMDSRTTLILEISNLLRHQLVMMIFIF